jgi:peptidoglycan/LPS O-acetylase OafA/YrhL
MDKRIPFIDTLTPLRGIAAIWVVIFHYDAFLGGPKGTGLFNHETTMVVGNGYLLVDFFFLLSGFVICHVYGDKLMNKDRGQVRKYIWARFSRLYPLHLFALLFLLAQFAAFSAMSTEYFESYKGFFKVYDFFVYLLFGQSSSILSNYSWNLPSWSIAAEWWTYLLAIFIIPLINKGFSRITYVFWGLSLIGLFLLTQYGGKGNLDYTLDFGTLRCLFEFTLGLGIYQVYRKVKDSNTFWKSDWAFYISIVGAYLFLHLNIHDLFVIIFFGGIILSASLNNGIPYQILNIKPLRFLGDISYSVYLLQLFWLFLFLSYKNVNFEKGIIPDMTTKLLILGVLLALLIFNSYLTYRFLEIPAQRYLRNKFSAKKATEEPVVSPVEESE